MASHGVLHVQTEKRDKMGRLEMPHNPPRHAELYCHTFSQQQSHSCLIFIHLVE